MGGVASCHRHEATIDLLRVSLQFYFYLLFIFRPFSPINAARTGERTPTHDISKRVFWSRIPCYYFYKGLTSFSRIYSRKTAENFPLKWMEKPEKSGNIPKFTAWLCPAITRPCFVVETCLEVCTRHGKCSFLFLKTAFRYLLRFGQGRSLRLVKFGEKN